MVRLQMFWFWLCPPGRTHCLPHVAAAHPPRLLSLTEIPAAVEYGGHGAAGRPDLADEVGEEANRRGQVKHVADQRPARPWFAIGGVTLGRLDDVLAAGATRVVVVRAIREADDPAAATRAFEENLAAVSPGRQCTGSHHPPRLKRWQRSRDKTGRVATDNRRASVAEPKIVVEHREHLWYLLAEAAQVEHLIMCQYLYASFSLKTGPDEGLTAGQAAAVARWYELLTGIAVEEMLHLALVFNVMTAIGAAPPLSRPNFPRHSDDLPGGVQFALLPFGADSLTHFLYLERPEGMERADAAGFVPAAPPRAPVQPDEVMPRGQDFGTVGHLYRSIEQGLKAFSERIGERAVFVGPQRAQASPELFRWPQLITVHDLQTAMAAVSEIIEQGEGARATGSPPTMAGSSASGRSTASSPRRIRRSSRPARSSRRSPASRMTSPSRSR